MNEKFQKDYQVGRTNVLKHLGQGSIFKTEQLKQKYEECAKQNIKNEIEFINSCTQDPFL